MSTEDLERELARRRGEDVPESSAQSVSTDDALAYRNRGNLPDELGRTLRLVLRIENEEDLASLDTKRLEYEPDYHEQPAWRVEGSKPVNVVPLRAARVTANSTDAWWDDETMASMEDEWRRTGMVGGLKIPADYRSFVYKTIAALRSAGRPVTVESVVASIARWLAPADADEIRVALEEAQASEERRVGRPEAG